MHNGVPDASGTGGEFWIIRDAAHGSTTSRCARSRQPPRGTRLPIGTCCSNSLVTDARCNGYGDVDLPDPRVGAGSARTEVPRVRLAVALLVPEPAATEIDGLRRALGDPGLAKVVPHITLVTPVNIAVDRVPDVLADLRAARRRARSRSTCDSVLQRRSRR